MSGQGKTVFGVGALLTVLIVSSVYFAGRNRSASFRVEKSVLQNKQRATRELDKFTFDDVWSSKFRYNSVNPQWVSGDQYIFMDSKGIYLRKVTTQTDTLLMPISVYTENSASSYKVSATQEYILLLTNYNKIWRHSYNGTYLIFDVTRQKLLENTTLPDNIQYMTWAPTQNALAYVFGYDIYYRSDPFNVSRRVTTTGRVNSVYNGIPDWVYEEEMISSNNVIYFSPDGMHLAFAQFNDTGCGHIEFIRYENEQYPKLIDVSYPKAGTQQPTNKVFIYNTENEAINELSPPERLSTEDYLFSRVTWADNNRAAVLWCDRAQTWSVTAFCDFDGTSSWPCTAPEAFDHKVEGGWLYQRRPYWIPVFGQTSDEFFKVLPNNKWQHLALVNSTNTEFLTSGEYTVTSESASYPAIEFYDADSDQVYFVATIEGPGKRQIYRVSGHKPGNLQCITCPLASSNPGRCDYVTVSFSTDASYAVVGCRGEGAPKYVQYRVDHEATDVEDVLVDEVILENNDLLIDALATTNMSQAVHGTFKSSSGYDLHYEQWNPPNFNEADSYPLLIDVYAGPGYQNVDYLWTRSWAPRYVPAGLDVVVVRIDGRGSNFYGDELMHEVYLQLGQKEIDDQIEAARYFGDKNYIDKSRIAIWGWSYGGFSTSHAIGQATDILKCGMAVAPLTDWSYYDTIYAERYMGLPTENKEGYEAASVMNKAANFPQSSYYLIHGMADDNVHFQSSAQLEKALVKENIEFNNFFYADQAHSINSGNAYKHVYQILTKQLCECFEIPVPSDVWE